MENNVIESIYQENIGQNSIAGDTSDTSDTRDSSAANFRVIEESNEIINILSNNTLIQYSGEEVIVSRINSKGQKTIKKHSRIRSNRYK